MQNKHSTLAQTIGSKFNKLKLLVNKNNFLLAVLISVLLLVLSLGIGHYASKVLQNDNIAEAKYSLEPRNIFNYMAHWDGIDYINIAKHGYVNQGLDNFFPAYPGLIHLVNYVVPSALDSALLIAWVGLVFSIYFYLKIARKLFNIKDISVVEAVLFYIFFPTAIFLVAPYTESLFSALALGGIYFALNKRYILTALMVALATATHITGILVLLLVILILFEQKLSYFKLILTFILSSLGLVTFVIYLKAKFNAPLLSFINAQKAHGWLIHTDYSYLYHTANIFNLSFIVLIILSSIYWWSRKRSFAIYSLLFLLIPFIGRQFGGFNRYVLVAFPIPLMLYGYLRNKRTGYLIALVVFVILWSYFTVLYTTGYIGS